IAVYLNINWERENCFVCSQFVAYTINKIGIKLEKPFSLYKPDDFRRFPNADLYYAGELNCFYDDVMTNKGIQERTAVLP
ncbi:MAG: hypothetical protein K2J47_09715, partial [Ruminococcus sp.]|nr:hypothetical protein [Ruminococcus sp.]